MHPNLTHRSSALWVTVLGLIVSSYRLLRSRRAPAAESLGEPLILPARFSLA